MAQLFVSAGYTRSKIGMIVIQFETVKDIYPENKEVNTQILNQVLIKYRPRISHAIAINHLIFLHVVNEVLRTHYKRMAQMITTALV